MIEVKYYRSTIAPARTIGEIQAFLAMAGAQAVIVEYDGGEPEALSFIIAVDGRPVRFRLPINWRGVHQLLQRDTRAAAAQKTEEQARRTAWRLVRDWVEAQVYFAQAGQASLAQLMLPHALDERGQTLFEQFRQWRALPPVKEDWDASGTLQP